MLYAPKALSEPFGLLHSGYYLLYGSNTVFRHPWNCVQAQKSNCFSMYVLFYQSRGQSYDTWFLEWIKTTFLRSCSWSRPCWSWSWSWSWPPWTWSRSRSRPVWSWSGLGLGLPGLDNISADGNVSKLKKKHFACFFWRTFRQLSTFEVFKVLELQAYASKPYNRMTLTLTLVVLI